MSLTFGHVVLSKVYGAAWRSARPILRRNRRIGDGFARRLVPEDWARPADIWLQAASGGEAYLIRELLRAWLHLPAETIGEAPLPLHVLATTWTRQGLEVLQGLADELKAEQQRVRLQAALFPLDQPSLMYRAVRMVRPRLVVLLETELWPGLLFACTRCRVPVIVLNGRLTPGSARAYRALEILAPGFWQAVGPRLAAAVSQADADRYAAVLGPERVVVQPNIKFDRALPPGKEPENSGAAAPAAALLPPDSEGRRVLLASVREQEEVLLPATVKRLRGNGAFVIVAPRHMHRVAAWKARLEEAGLACCLRSALHAGAPARQDAVLLWDAFGELSALYGVVDAVFVGGSLAPLGGQNFLEPLSLGRIPCTGPHLDNFVWALGALTAPSCTRDEAGRSLQQAGLIEICSDAGMVADRLLHRLQQPESPEAVKAGFRAWLAPRRGGAAAAAGLLAEQLR